MKKIENLIKVTQDALCNGCENYRNISFNKINNKACYCNMNPLNCVLAKKLNK